MNRFQKKGIALGLALSLLASVPVLANADGVDMTPEQIVAEYNRLKALEAGDSLDAFVHSLSEEQRKALLADVIKDALEENGKTQQESAREENSISWTLDEKGLLTVTGKGEMVDFSKPESAPWHDKRSEILSVAVEQGITRIGAYAFADCPNLTEYSLPGSVAEIGDYAFRGCSGLKKLTLPAALQTIGTGAFAGCTLIQSVTVPEGVKTIGAEAFRDCTALKSITLPGTLEALGDFAFAGCTALSGGHLPQELKELGSGVFAGCTALKSMTIPSGVTVLNNGIFKDCTALSNVTLHKDVRTIGEEAFSGCVSLQKMIMPENLTSIEDRAFSGCVSLSRITIPEKVTKLGAEAFDGCEKLESIKMNDRLTEVGENCFRGCSMLNLPMDDFPASQVETEPAELGKEPLEEPETVLNQEETEVQEPENTEPEETPEPGITVENITASAGNTVTLAVSLRDNPGIVSMSLNVKFDENVMKLVKIEDTGLLSGGEHKAALSSPFRLNWANDTLTTDIRENGRIAELTFEISEDAQKGAYPISLEFDPANGDIYNSALEAVAFLVEDGGITVVNAVLGDVNGDGVINGQDRAALSRYLTVGREALQDIDLSAADVNGDGKVNNVDRAILSRYLAGWAGYETLPGSAE